MGDAWLGEMELFMNLGRRLHGLRQRKAAGECVDPVLLKRIGQRMDRIVDGTDVPPTLRKADRGKKEPRREAVVVEQTVDNPFDTDGLREAGAGQRRIRITRNLVERIGGLARIKGRTEAQEEAAALYRQLWEGAQLGAGRAIDYGRLRVDTSGVGSDGGLGGVMDASDARKRCLRAIGQIHSALLDQVVCQDMSLRELARRHGLGNGRAVLALQQDVLRAVDAAAVHFQLMSRPAKAA